MWRFGAVSVRPCASFEAGRLQAKGAGTADNKKTVRLPWTAAGLSGLADLELGGRLWMGTELGAELPLLRDTFYFAPDPGQAGAGRIQPIGVSASFHLGVTIL